MDQKPEVRIKVRPAGIPPELTELPRWIVWKHMWSKKQSKWVKAPYQVSGSLASSTDASTWSTFKEACAALNGYDGLGFVFNGDGVTGIDLDKVIDERGRWSDTATQALQDVTGYAELSPSGRGLHIITRAPHIGTGKSKGGIEAYSTGRYFTFTGHQLNGHASVPSSEQDIAPFLAAHFGEVARSAAPVNDLDEALSKPPTGKTIGHMALVLRHVKTPDYEPECTPYIWAIHHEASGSAEGLQLAHDWCSGKLHDKEYPEYDFDYVEERWARSRDDKGNAKTWRSVEFEAKKNGWKANALSPRAPADSGFVPAAQFASSQRVEWHIKHVLPKRGLIVVYGDPGSSKSFFTLDMVAHVARGLVWRGHRVSQANVAYIAAEGVAGFGNRLAAYAKHHAVSLNELPVFVRGGAFDLKEQFLDISEKINEIGNVGVVVIDTLAAVTAGGNENTSEDMGSAIDAAQRIIESTGASVILIHHSNNQGGVRGWSGLRGAVDNQIRIERKDSLRTAHIEKQKEGEDGKAYGYRLQVVHLYDDEDGDPVTSCAIVEDDDVAPNTRGTKKEKKSTGGDFSTSDKYAKARKYLEIIRDAAGLGDANIDETDVITAIQSDETVNPLKESDYPRPDNIKRTLLTLGEHGKIKREGRWIRVCE